MAAKTKPRCAECGKPATCLGRSTDPIEAQHVWTYCCDDCCGHGQEDGECIYIGEHAEIAAKMTELHRQVIELDLELDAVLHPPAPPRESEERTKPPMPPNVTIQLGAEPPKSEERHDFEGGGCGSGTLTDASWCQRPGCSLPRDHERHGVKP